MHLKYNKNEHKKELAVAKTNVKLQNPGSVAFYDIWPGNYSYRP